MESGVETNSVDGDERGGWCAQGCWDSGGYMAMIVMMAESKPESEFNYVTVVYVSQLEIMDVTM